MVMGRVNKKVLKPPLEAITEKPCFQEKELLQIVLIPMITTWSKGQNTGDYNNRPSNTISLMAAVATTSGNLHCELVRILLLRAHRETCFFAASGVEHAKQNQDQFRYRRAAFYSQLKSKVGNVLAKATAQRINLNIDGASIASRAHAHPSHSQTLSPPIHFPLLRYPLPPLHLVCARLSPPPALDVSLSPHRHPFQYIPPSSCFSHRSTNKKSWWES
jgi:hypothetical protein